MTDATLDYRIPEPTFVPFNDCLTAPQDASSGTIAHKEPFEGSYTSSPDNQRPPPTPEQQARNPLLEYHNILEEFEDKSSETASPSDTEQRQGPVFGPSEMSNPNRQSVRAEVVRTAANNPPARIYDQAAMGAAIPIPQENQLISSLPSEDLLREAFVENDSAVSYLMDMETLDGLFDVNVLGSGLDLDYADDPQLWGYDFAL